MSIATTPVTSLPMEGLTVLVTGNITGMSRQAATAAVVALGGKSVSAVSGKVDLVVAGDGAGVSKMDKARIHGCLVMTGERFADLAAAPWDWDGVALGVPHAEWESGISAEAGSEDDAEPPAPRPGDPDYVPFAMRHLITTSTDHRIVEGQWRSQYRLACQCGHRWAEPLQYLRTPTCPVEAGIVDEPTLHAPWADEPSYTGPGIKRRPDAPAPRRRPAATHALVPDEPPRSAQTTTVDHPTVQQPVQQPVPPAAVVHEPVLAADADLAYLDTLTHDPWKPTWETPPPVREPVPFDLIDPAQGLDDLDSDPWAEQPDAPLIPAPLIPASPAAAPVAVPGSVLAPIPEPIPEPEDWSVPPVQMRRPLLVGADHFD